MKVKMFQSLIVWQKGHQLVLDIYRKTKNFPDDERFCFVLSHKCVAQPYPLLQISQKDIEKEGRKTNLAFSIYRKALWLKFTIISSFLMIYNTFRKRIS